MALPPRLLTSSSPGFFFAAIRTLEARGLGLGFGLGFGLGVGLGFGLGLGRPADSTLDLRERTSPGVAAALV